MSCFILSSAYYSIGLGFCGLWTMYLSNLGVSDFLLRLPQSSGSMLLLVEFLSCFLLLYFLLCCTWVRIPQVFLIHFLAYQKTLFRQIIIIYEKQVLVYLDQVLMIFLLKNVQSKYVCAILIFRLLLMFQRMKSRIIINKLLSFVRLRTSCNKTRMFLLFTLSGREPVRKLYGQVGCNSGC